MELNVEIVFMSLVLNTETVRCENQQNDSEHTPTIISLNNKSISDLNFFLKCPTLIILLFFHILRSTKTKYTKDYSRIAKLE